jgi:hypothetical protein
MTMQMTINVNGDRIKVTTRRHTHLGMFKWYRSVVNGVEFIDQRLVTLREAMETAYANYVKSHR